MDRRLIAALKCIVAKDDDEELEQTLQWMKESGLVPDGKGPPTKPSTATPHWVAYDPDFNFYYLVTKKGAGGAVWTITDDGKSEFISTYTGKFDPGPNVTIYDKEAPGDGKESYEDYMPIEAIRAILDIVDPSWSEPTSDEEREYIEQLERQEKGH